MFGQQAGMRLPTEVQRYYESALWSTQLYADATALAGRASDSLFGTRKGGNGNGFAASLTIAETNMDEAGRIASGLAFTTRQVACEVRYTDNFPMCHMDLANVQKNLVLTWSFLNTFVHIAPVNLIGQGGGIFGTTADTGAADGANGGSRTILNNGAGQTWIYHELPVLLPANTTFSVQLQWGGLATAVDGGVNNSAMEIRGSLIGVATSAIPEG